MNMKTIFLIPLFLALLVLNVQAQDREFKQGNKYAGHFDTNTIETQKGRITAVYTLSSEKGLGSKVKFDLKTDDETIRIHVGPSWYILDKGFEFTEGDKIKVTGSRVLIGENIVLIASKIVKGGKTLKLRDSKGVPLWIGWGLN